MVDLTSEERAHRNQMIRALLKTLDLNAPGERSHAERVAVYSVATGEKLGLSESELLNLRYAALLHDVGKAKLDSATLAKVGRLLDSEIAEMKLHAELSVRLIETIEFLHPCIPMIRHHHERFNGMGYPAGLSGTTIPLESRIIGLAEAFDVISFGAAWKSKISRRPAIAEIERGRHVEWDPEVLDAFLLILPVIQPLGSD